jgi:tetratricopeptide (TPR) repeat protein
VLKQTLALWTAVFPVLTALLIVIQPSFVSAQVSPDSTVYTDRAILAYDAKRYDEALREVMEALRVSPNSVDALYYQALILSALKRPSEARASLEKALKVRPGDLDVTFQLGVLYFNQKEYEKAEPLMLQVYRAEPKRPNVGYYLGFMEYRKKNYRTAVKYFRAAVPSDKKFAQLTRFYNGLAVGALGYPQQARAEIEQALRLEPVSPLASPARRFGEVLEKKAEEERYFSGDLQLGVYYDTNVPVISNPSSDLTAEAIRNSQRRRKSEGELVSLNLYYNWLKPLCNKLKSSEGLCTPDWEGTLSHRFFQTYNNNLTEFNTQSHTPTIGILNKGTVKPFSDELPYFAGFQYTFDFITLGNKKFVERWILNPYFTLVEKPFTVPFTVFPPTVSGEAQRKVNNLTTIQYRFQAINFWNEGQVVRQEQRDAQNYMFGPTHFFLSEDGRHYLKLGYQYDFENAEGPNWTYWGSRALLGVQYTLPKDWGDIRLRYELDYHWRRYKNKHTLLPTGRGDTRKRRDREGVHFVSMAKDFAVDSSKSFPFVSCSNSNCPYTFTVDYLYVNVKNDSNLGPFDYNRHVVTTSINWRFDSSTFDFITKATPSP